LRVAAVSFLNTTPLVWGMLHGEQRGRFDLDFCLPSECADRLSAGAADIGILPVAELPRLGLELIPGSGIACRGAVRSILLISKVDPRQIRILAADTSSRTSVQLARVLLARNYAAFPRLVPAAPDLDTMLGLADAALIIGDPALRVEVERSPYRILDLGAEWTVATGLPMVFAVWAGRKECVTPALKNALLDSCRFGLAHIEEIVRREAAPRGISEELARDYLTPHVKMLLDDKDYRGMELFLRQVASLDAQRPVVESTPC
jgi:predicted solute-binding protein